MSVTSVKKNRLPPWGIHWGLPEQSLGQRGNGWGADAILAVGWWIALAIASARRARAAARARPWRFSALVIFCGPT